MPLFFACNHHSLPDCFYLWPDWPFYDKLKKIEGNRILSSSKHKYIFILAFLVIINLSSLLRFYDLDLRPLHHDEGNNARWAFIIKEGVKYSIEPGGRHGPLPHLLNALAFHLFGDSDLSVRFFASLFGIGLLALHYPYRGLLSNAGTLGSVLLLGVSPLMVYYSRFAINEIFLTFFTLAFALSIYLWILEGKTIHFLTAAGVWALMVATKETWIINLMPIGAALVVTYHLHRPLYHRALPPLKISSRLTPKIVGLGILLSFFLIIAFYTTFFTNLKDLRYLYRYHSFWVDKGLAGGEHLFPFFTYLTNLYHWEWPVLLLAGISILLWLKFRDPLGTYLVFWAFFTFLVYSLIQYKTPWLSINILLPWGVLAGRSLHYLKDTFLKTKISVWLMGLLLLGGFVFSLEKTLDLNFRRYDDPSLWVVYFQEPRHIKKLYRQIYQVAKAQDNPKNVKINLFLGFYERSPTSWYLRRFPGKILLGNRAEITQAEMVLFSDSTEYQVLPELKAENYETGRITSYPGLVLHLWIKKEAWKLYLKKNSESQG